MQATNRTIRGALLLLAVCITAAGVAACGGSNGAKSKNAAATTTTPKGSGYSAFTACLKQHGVTLPSGAGHFRFGQGTTTNGYPSGRPGGYPGGGYGGGGFPGGGSGFGGGFFHNSKYAKAFSACRSKMPKGAFPGGQGFRGPAGGGPAGSGHYGFHFSAATLKRFVSCVRSDGYPSMPEASASGKFPTKVETNPKFRKAASKCVSILLGHPRAGTSTTPATSTSTGSVA